MTATKDITSICCQQQQHCPPAYPSMSSRASFASCSEDGSTSCDCLVVEQHHSMKTTVPTTNNTSTCTNPNSSGDNKCGVATRFHSNNTEGRLHDAVVAGYTSAEGEECDCLILDDDDDDVNNEEECRTADDDDECDACPFCNDTCNNQSCRTCSGKRIAADAKNEAQQHHAAQQQQQLNGSSAAPPCSFYYGNRRCNNKDYYRRYTICQVRRHNSKKSAWLVADGCIYDATAYIKWHPGGERSILRYSGGVKDCKEDLDFHSKNAQRLWKKFQIGVLSQCHGTELCQSLYLEAQRHNEGCSIC
eukprot:CAMPEP_0196808404 /NCGR_PEP_ID=MMETSP1362-20130617/8389_1 /TAXON_ID=163516 /ORGANISM="Leptocylindrus danicus, Strain CCMP1856" /LENGTH=303 /DNA_ID=CAMNT_0042182733 /DNA_START=367 /DNA_END=1278 /DNA_ORIENTATION=+